MFRLTFTTAETVFASFNELTEISLPGVYSGSGVWGDYYDDGDLDFLIFGNDRSSTCLSKIFRNDGGDVFLEVTEIVIAGLSGGSAAWVDYDNDGDLDLIINGHGSSSTPICKIYRNKGSDTFEEVSGISLPALGYSSMAWGDYDNDGDFDVLISGQNSGNQNISQVYRNDGSDNFTLVTEISLYNLFSVKWPGATMTTTATSIL